MGGLIVIDSLGFTVELSNVLQGQGGCCTSHRKGSGLWYAFSHTHSAPNAAEEPDYFEMVCRQADTCCPEGRGKNGNPWRRPGELGKTLWGVNRRNEPEQMDGRLGILKLAARTGKEPEVLLIRVTAHANVLSGDNYLSPQIIWGPQGNGWRKHTAARDDGTGSCQGISVPDIIRTTWNMWRFTAGRWPGKDFHRNTGKNMCLRAAGPLEQMAEDMFRSVDAVYASLVLMPLERVEIRSSFLPVSG